MRKPVLTIFYQFDPGKPSIGGIQTVIRSFIKYAPSEFEVRLVGIPNQPNLSKGQWSKVKLAGREIDFLPLFILLNDNFRSLVPTIIKYTAALLKQGITSDFMHFHRLEPAATLNDANAHLLIAGDGELAELQRICSVFVLTSTYEGLPLVALEALACGTPVVTTSCGETPKLLDVHSGIVCQERNSQAIAAALKKVLTHPENYPIEACVRITEPYSAKAIVSAVYKNMLSRWQTKLNYV